MKLRFFLLVVGVLLGLMTYAQPPGGQGRQFDPEAMVKRQTEQMVTDLKLNADQTTKVQELNKKYSDKMRELFQDAQGDRSQMREKMGKLRDEKNVELKEILTPEQYKKHLELEEQRMEERRQRMEERRESPERRGTQRQSPR
ncbi:DUF4890 domain-containing protein [Roseimarinus sediminis]|uniref:DUF4890 domain-containing protein n=1 Tax=Roseimarinus sediminis TaxID=1610899 RepID=UPI003D1BCE97